MTEISWRVGGEIPLGGWDQVFARSPLPMLVLVDGIFVRANEAAGELLGVPPTDLLGSPVMTVIEPHLMTEAFLEAERQYLSGDRHLQVEGPLVRGDGEERWVSINAVLIDTGASVTTVAAVTDITALHEARTELAASERRFRSLLTNISDTVSLTDADGRLLYSTGGHNQVLGYSQDFWDELSPFELIHPDDVATATDGWEEGMRRPGEEVTREVRMRAADGSYEHVSVTGVNLLHDPDVGGVVVTTRNISALRRAERLASSQAHVLELIARGAALAEVSAACVEFVETNGISGVSSIYLLQGDALEIRAGRGPAALNEYVRGAERHAGRSLCDTAMEGRSMAVLADLDAADPAAEGMDPELVTIVRDAGIRAAWSQPILSISTGEPVGSISTIYDEPHEPSEHERAVGAAAASLVSIALERVDTEGRLAHQALHDGLTGLPNRTLLLDRLDHALARRARKGTQIALLFCDIDRFKVINDSLGHGVGDQLLVAFADRYRRVVDPSDTVARFGGDEFVVLLEDIPHEDHALVAAARLAAALDRPFVLPEGQEVHLTASIGLAYASDHLSGDAWLRDADAAMYRAKERGRNRLALFDREMRAAAMARLEVESDLRRAVDRDELEVWMQPLVRLETGRICGAEALVRWRHPTRGVLSPAEFIEVAEDTGMIDEIGRHVLDLAVDAASRLDLPDGPEGFQLGVNVSARQIATPGLDEQVAEVCARHGWPLSSLLLEITETTLLHRMDGPVDVLTRIHDLGAELAIDDFGTGYSSLTRLGHMPVDQVKIDQSFVAAIGRPGSRLVRIVDAVHALADALELVTVAEGVETLEQLEYVRRLGCHQAQGYLFAKPLPQDAFADLVRERPRW